MYLPSSLVPSFILVFSVPSFVQINDEALQLIGANCPNLITLNVHGCKVGEIGGGVEGGEERRGKGEGEGEGEGERKREGGWGGEGEGEGEGKRERGKGKGGGEGEGEGKREGGRGRGKGRQGEGRGRVVRGEEKREEEQK